MSKSYLEAVSFVKQIIYSTEFMKKFWVKPSLFTRCSAKLSFPILCRLILSLSKKSAKLKLDLFLRIIANTIKLTYLLRRRFFFEARLKIQQEAFERLNFEFIDWFYKNNENLKRFDKSNVFASDGSYLEIPADKKLKTFFEFKSKSADTTTVRAGANVIFDVWNNKTVCRKLHKYSIWERQSFAEMFENFKKLAVTKQQNNLFIFDRGFSSSILVKLIENAWMFYLFRLKKDAFKFASQLQSDDETVTHTTFEK